MPDDMTIDQLCQRIRSLFDRREPWDEQAVDALLQEIKQAIKALKMRPDPEGARRLYSMDQIRERWHKRWMRMAR